MACGELAALRLGLASIMGRDDQAERAHDEAELKVDGKVSAALTSLAGSENLATLSQRYSDSLSFLEKKIASLAEDDAQMPYYRTLLVTTKKVEMELLRHQETLKSFYEDLDEVHDFIHEVYPN